jgi:hypothetical protein
MSSTIKMTKKTKIAFALTTVGCSLVMAGAGIGVGYALRDIKPHHNTFVGEYEIYYDTFDALEEASNKFTPDNWEKDYTGVDPEDSNALKEIASHVFATKESTLYFATYSVYYLIKNFKLPDPITHENIEEIKGVGYVNDDFSIACEFSMFINYGSGQTIYLKSVFESVPLCQIYVDVRSNVYVGFGDNHSSDNIYWVDNYDT